MSERNGVQNGVVANRGRQSPHNAEAEEALLGAMLLSRDAIAAAGEILNAGHFYRPAHGHIYAAISALAARSEPADPVTVADELLRNGLLDAAGGTSALIGLQTLAPAASSAARYARIVADRWALRQVIEAAGEIAEAGHALPDDVDAMLAAAERRIAAISAARSGGTTGLVTGRAAAAQAVAWSEAAQQRRENGGGISGVPTGLDDLDELLDGWPAGALVVIGARPAMGKTAMAVTSALSACGRGAVFLASVEMNAREIGDRLTASVARVSAASMRAGKLADKDWERVITHLDAVPANLLIDESPSNTVSRIAARARQARREHGPISAVFVDYLGLLDQDSTGARRDPSRAEEVGANARALKILAGELGCPVVVLAQLNRGLESRTDKRPTLHDFRDSGEIEQHAAIAIGLYRDEVYNPGKDVGIAEIIVLKNRFGPTGTVRAAWLGQYTKFAGMART